LQVKAKAKKAAVKAKEDQESSAIAKKQQDLNAAKRKAAVAQDTEKNTASDVVKTKAKIAQDKADLEKAKKLQSSPGAKAAVKAEATAAATVQKAKEVQLAAEQKVA